jgi:hypothetical protein
MNIDSIMTYFVLKKLMQPNDENTNKQQEIKAVEENIVNRKSFERAKKELKDHFVGIDEVIDRIFKEIELWYFHPEVLVRPTIINLWGMPGVGKTDLVRRLAKALQLNNKFCNIELDDSSDNSINGIFTKYRNNNVTILNKLIEKDINVSDKSILLLDEMHRFNSISNNSYIKRDEYQDIWRLLSDGILWDEVNILKEMKNTINNLQNFYKRYLGVSFNNNDISTLDKYLMAAYPETFKNNNTSTKSRNDLTWEEANAQNSLNNIVTFNSVGSNSVNTNLYCKVLDITEEDKALIRELMIKYQGIEAVLYFDLSNHKENITNEYILSSCSNRVILEFFKKKYDDIISEREKRDENENDLYNDKFVYSKMLIFIAGNMEKIYSETTYDADKLFEVLQTMFRPEQLSRLGSVHIIYPYIKAEHLMTIAEREINKYEKFLQNKYNKDIMLPRKIIWEYIQDSKADARNGVRPFLTIINSILNRITPEHLLSLLTSTL